MTSSPRAVSKERCQRFLECGRVGDLAGDVLAPAVTWIRPLRSASLFYWAVGDQQLARGAGLGSFAVLGAVAIVVSIAATTALRRLDIR